jgi:hypothetical protein
MWLIKRRELDSVNKSIQMRSAKTNPMSVPSDISLKEKPAKETAIEKHKSRFAMKICQFGFFVLHN